jgi:hypothetical protein
MGGCWDGCGGAEWRRGRWKGADWRGGEIDEGGWGWDGRERADMDGRGQSVEGVRWMGDGAGVDGENEKTETSAAIDHCPQQ